MIPFSYERVNDADAALKALHAGSKFLGGGTNLVDLMKDQVERPAALVDVNHAGMDEISVGADGGHVGASVRNSALANDANVVRYFPLLSQALLSGASPQLRNMATTAGNLMQRTRCPYFMDTAFSTCNKRVPGSGCGAVGGFNRMHAVLGQTDDGAKSAKTCIAVNPSDMNVALAALGATVEVRGPKGKRSIPVREFHRLVGEDPTRDTVLGERELITGVLLPKARFGKNSWYLKARDRQSYAFALVSVAAGLEMDGETIKSAGLALGGVAHKPWVSAEVDHMLAGKPATEKTFAMAADALLHGAKGYSDNAFKIALAKDCIVRACMMAAKGVQA